MAADSAMRAQSFEIECIIISISRTVDNVMQKFPHTPSAAREVLPLRRLAGTTGPRNHRTAMNATRMPMIDKVFISGVSAVIKSAFMTFSREMQIMQIGAEMNATELRSRLRRILFSIFRISFQRKNPPIT